MSISTGSLAFDLALWLFASKKDNRTEYELRGHSATEGFLEIAPLVSASGTAISVATLNAWHGFFGWRDELRSIPDVDAYFARQEPQWTFKRIKTGTNEYGILAYEWFVKPDIDVMLLLIMPLDIYLTLLTKPQKDIRDLLIRETMGRRTVFDRLDKNLLQELHSGLFWGIEALVDAPPPLPSQLSLPEVFMPGNLLAYNKDERKLLNAMRKRLRSFRITARQLAKDTGLKQGVIFPAMKTFVEDGLLIDGEEPGSYAIVLGFPGKRK
jgi:hypothetical protein